MIAERAGFDPAFRAEAFPDSRHKYRLIAVVDYTLQFVSIEHVLTHSEYDEGRWRK